MPRTLMVLLLATMCSVALAQDYSNARQQSERLKNVAKNKYASLETIATTAGSNPVYMLTLSKGDHSSRPAVAIIGGVEGNHLLGAELAIGFAENLVKLRNEMLDSILARTTYYIFPNMSPDAMEQYFSSKKFERMGNGASTDDDRDGEMNEDGFDDLDGDGIITWMRISSPIGTHKVSSRDPRSILTADPSKGENGIYTILSEGRDNDKDGKFNEDGDGGIDFNKSLTYSYKPFIAGAGEFAVAQPESRALLDELYQLFNVYAVVSFSSNNNLSDPVKFNKQATTGRVITGYLEPDAKVNAMVSELYKRTSGLKDAPKTTPDGGDLLSWAYFHYGRFSFSTPGWAVPKQKPDSTKKEKPVADSVADLFAFYESGNLPVPFTPWKRIDHPDFPGEVVEVGGVHPFALVNPPYSQTPEIVQKHTDFILGLAALQPEIELVNIRTESHGGGLTRVTATIRNKGNLPSHTNLGERSIWVKRVKVIAETSTSQSLISGKKINLLPVLPAKSSQEVSWLIRGKGKFTITAGAPTTGTDSKTITL